MSVVRLATEADAPLLPPIERSAAESFRAVPGLEWIAEDTVLSEEDHRAAIRAGDVWIVADEDDRPFGFLSAERIDGELHIHELSVRRDRQGQGHGRRLADAAIAQAKAMGSPA